MTEQSFSVQPSSLRAFAQELQTQLDGIAAPMNTLATQSGTQPQFGAFTEAWMLGESQQSAIQQMYDLLGQVKQALGFAENVTTTVASAYQNADQDVAASYGAPGTTTTSAAGTTTTSAAGTTTTSAAGTTSTSGTASTAASGSGATSTSGTASTAASGSGATSTSGTASTAAYASATTTSPVVPATAPPSSAGDITNLPAS